MPPLHRAIVSPPTVEVNKTVILAERGLVLARSASGHLSAVTLKQCCAPQVGWRAPPGRTIDNVKVELESAFGELAVR